MQYLDNNINKKNTMEEYINQVFQYCSENGINTYEEIRSLIFNDIWKSYKNKAPRGKIEAITDDIAESVALRMGISETGKNVVNINESQLKQIIAESTNRILNEFMRYGLRDALKGAVRGFRTGATRMSAKDNYITDNSSKNKELYQYIIKAYNCLENENDIESGKQFLKNAYEFVMKNTININESQLKSIVTESVRRMLMELDLNGYMDDLNTMNGDDFFKVSNDYSGNYEELIKEEMASLTELERKVPEWIKPDIHSMAVKMESILSQCQRNREYSNL